MLFLLLLLLSNCDLTFFTFWDSIKYLGNIFWEVLLLAKLGKLNLFLFSMPNEVYLYFKQKINCIIMEFSN